MVKDDPREIMFLIIKMVIPALFTISRIFETF